MMDRMHEVPGPILSRYVNACQKPSDINEHLPLLYELASRCEHVTEFGLRSGDGSTLAFLAAQPRTFVTWDVNPWAVVRQPVADLLAMGATAPDGRWRVGRTSFEPRVGSTLECAIEPTDLLFIDTLHTAAQLLAELKRHADPKARKVKKYLVFHDTKTFGDVGEDGSTPGLRTAIRVYQRNHAFPLWGLKYDHANNNGLVVLERVDVDPTPGVMPDPGQERFK